MTRILILGRNGQVGQELIHTFADTNNVTALGRADIDLTDASAIRSLLRTIKPAIVINAAAYTAVDDAEIKTAEAMAVNRDAPAAIAQEILAWRGALIHYSTDYIFDGRKGSPYDENDVPAPINHYGRSKLEGEQAIVATGGAYLILRTSWVYGAGNNFCRTVWRLAKQREEMRVADDQTGSPTLAKTIARVTRLIIEKYGEKIPDVREIFNVAGAGKVSRHEFATEILRLLYGRYGEHAAKARRITAVSSSEFKTPAARPGYSALATHKLRSKLGIEMPPWQNDLAEFVATSPDSIWT